MNKAYHFGGKLELKLAPSDTSVPTFDGYGAVFNNLDHARDRIAPGAFRKSISEHKTAGSFPQMFFNHRMHDIPIGIWTSLEEDEHGLKVAGEFLDTTNGRDAYTAVKAGAVTGLSIGYFATGYENDGDTRTITEAKLVEISVVTFPCNELARVGQVKSLEDEEFFDKLIELGVSDDDAKALVAKRGDVEEPEALDSEVEEAEVESDPEPEAGESEDHEDKYDETAIVAAIKSIVATIKEYNVG